MTFAATLGTAPLHRLPLRAGLARLAARQRARRAGGRADHVARRCSRRRSARSAGAGRAAHALAATRSRTSAWVAHAAAACRGAQVERRRRRWSLACAAVRCARRAGGDRVRRGARAAATGRSRRAARRRACSRVAVVLVARRARGAGARRAGPAAARHRSSTSARATRRCIQRRRSAILVDTGPPDGPIVARLRDAGVRRLDVLVVTHAQADHDGGGGRGAARAAGRRSSSTAATASASASGAADGAPRPARRTRAGRGARPAQVLRVGRRRRCACSGPRAPGRPTPGRTPTSARSSPRPTLGGVRTLLTGRRRVRRPRRRSTCAPVDVAQGLPPRQRRPRAAGAARSGCGRGSRAIEVGAPQHLRPPGRRRPLAALVAAGAAVDAHRPRRRRPRRASSAATMRRCASDCRRVRAPTPRLGRVPAFKPAYLIHGDDHGRIAERRARLRALAEAERAAAGSRSSRARRRRPRPSRPRSPR